MRITALFRMCVCVCGQAKQHINNTGTDLNYFASLLHQISNEKYATVFFLFCRPFRCPLDISASFALRPEAHVNMIHIWKSRNKNIILSKYLTHIHIWCWSWSGTLFCCSDFYGFHLFVQRFSRLQTCSIVTRIKCNIKHRFLRWRDIGVVCLSFFFN